MELTQISEQRLRRIFKSFNRFMMLIWRLGLGSWGNGTEFGGSIMVIKHTGRKTGLTRYTPVNYAVVDRFERPRCTPAAGDHRQRLRGIALRSGSEEADRCGFREINGQLSPDSHPAEGCGYRSGRSRRSGMGLASLDFNTAASMVPAQTEFH